MTQMRANKVAEQMKKDISQILHEEVKDPRIGFATVTDVELSPDLRHGKVFVSVFGTPEEKELAFKALNSAAAFIRREVGKRLPIRYTPEIIFREDVSIEHGVRIAELLNQVNKEDKGT